MRHQRMIWASIALAPVVVLSTIGAGAAQDDKRFNLHCLANFATIAGSAEGAQKTSATLGLVYFLGRLDEETPGFDIEAELKRLVQTETMNQIEGDLDRCRDVLKERGQQLIKAGDALQHLGPQGQ